MIGGMVLLALVCAGSWAGARWWQVPGTTLAVPIVPGHEIDISIWKPAFYYSSIDLNHTMPIPITGPLTVAIWYQQTGAAGMLPPVVLSLPAWPLPVIAAGMTLGALWLWCRARRAC